MRPSSVTSISLCFLLALALFSSNDLFGQQQPPVASNAQDEVVNVIKSADTDVSELTIFRTGEKEQKNEYISEVVELKNAVAFEVLPNVLRAVRLERGTARTVKYKVPGTDETRYFIQVVTTREQMPTIIETIKNLDLPGFVSSTGNMKYHVRMDYRRASEVASLLAATTLSGEGDVTFDDRTNTVYFEDSVSDGLRNIEVIKFYDISPPQVEFEIVAVEISEEDAERLGVDWDAWKTAVGGQFQLTGNEFEGGDDFARLDALLTVDARALASFLNYTMTTGTGDIITRTTLVGSNDRPAVFSSLRRLSSSGYQVVYTDPKELTEEVPGVDARQVGSGSDPNGKRPVVIVPPTRSRLVRTSLSPADPGATALDPSLKTGEKSEGMFLVIDPTIGRAMMSADIRFVLNSQVGEDRFGDPVISERLIDTNVTLRDAQPFSLGGLEKETIINTRTGIPVLKEVPLIKYLTSVESTRTANSKVYLVITPRVRNQMNYEAGWLNSSTFEIEEPYSDAAAEINDTLDHGLMKILDMTSHFDAIESDTK